MTNILLSQPWPNRGRRTNVKVRFLLVADVVPIAVGFFGSNKSRRGGNSGVGRLDIDRRSHLFQKSNRRKLRGLIQHNDQRPLETRKLKIQFSPGKESGQSTSQRK